MTLTTCKTTKVITRQQTQATTITSMGITMLTQNKITRTTHSSHMSMTRITTISLNSNMTNSTSNSSINSSISSNRTGISNKPQKILWQSQMRLSVQTTKASSDIPIYLFNGNYSIRHTLIYLMGFWGFGVLGWVAGWVGQIMKTVRPQRARAFNIPRLGFNCSMYW